jgi:ornithine decarboxylase
MGCVFTLIAIDCHSLPPSSLIASLITVFGPTCDSMDCVFKDVMLPQLRVGDWLLFPHFGA